MLQVLIFGQLVEVIGNSNIEAEYVTSVKELKSFLVTKFPNLTSKTFVVAVNNKIVNENAEIAEGSSIALLPPFSGG